MAPHGGGEGTAGRAQATTPAADAARPGAGGREAFLEAALDASVGSYTVLRAVRSGDEIVDWEIVDANELVRRRWAATVGEVVGARWSTLNAAADNAALETAFAAALRTHRRQELDVELVLPSDAGGWRRIVVVPIGEDVVSVTSRDVSRERYLETALHRERAARRAVVGPGRREPPTRAETKLLSRSASALFLGAGIVSLLNSFLAALPGVEVTSLRLTAVIAIASALALPLMPWARHPRLVAIGLVASGILILVVSDHFDHYSRTESAVAVYPVFFIMIVAWSGLTQVRAMPIIAACVSAVSLGGLLSSGDHGTIGWQCVIVTMPAAAVLGEVLSWSYRRAVGLARLETERRLRDPLTDLANRHLFVECLDQALARVRRDGRAAAVLFIDLDRFKQVNDSLGHGAGDELLVEAADRLRVAVRASDQVARFGGDEFAVLCEHLDAGVDAAEIATRVLEAFEQPFACSGRHVYVSASMGIAVSHTGTESPEALLQDADAAMYRAKERGRSRFEVFDETMRHWVASRLELESALRQALDRRELRVHYQPIVDRDSLAVRGFEALVRWERPGVGLVEPGKFIAVAEETGMVFAIGEWVMHEACRAAAEWTARWPDRTVGISVNVSSRQLLKGDAVEMVRGALSSSGLEPGLLTLELTETTLIDDAVTAQAVLLSLRELGVRIALDDFGTGYSSLTYLRAFPIDTIKIDETFVRTIDAERQGAAIVAAVVQLARNLGIDVVAEGIETPAQLEVVVALGCDALQGYLFSPPRPGAEVPGLVERFATPLVR